MTTYYEKRGNKYFPVGEQRYPDLLPYGIYLTIVQKGSTRIMLVGANDAAKNRALYDIVDMASRVHNIDTICSWLNIFHANRQCYSHYELAEFLVEQMKKLAAEEKCYTGETHGRVGE